MLFSLLILSSFVIVFVVVGFFFSVLFRLVSTCTTALMPWSGLSIRASQLGRIYPNHEWNKNNQNPIIRREPKQPTKGALLEHPGQEFKEARPLGPTGHLIQKATPHRLGVIAGISNI